MSAICEGGEVHGLLTIYRFIFTSAKKRMVPVKNTYSSAYMKTIIYCSFTRENRHLRFA